jgi:hypothetical protein
VRILSLAFLHDGPWQGGLFREVKYFFTWKHFTTTAEDRIIRWKWDNPDVEVQAMLEEVSYCNELNLL